MKRIVYLILLGFMFIIPKEVFAEVHKIGLDYLYVLDKNNESIFHQFNSSSTTDSLITYDIGNTFGNRLKFVGSDLNFINEDSTYDISFSFYIYDQGMYTREDPFSVYDNVQIETRNGSSNSIYGCTYKGEKNKPSTNDAFFSVSCLSVPIFKNNPWFSIVVNYGGWANFTPIVFYKEVNFVKKSDNEVVNGLEDMKKEQEKTNEKLDGINDTMNDSNVDMSGANSFFGDFSDTDHGGISSVITAPLNFINKMTETCSPLSLDVLGADVELPCGDTLFWNKPEVASFKVIWNILFGGAFLYFMITKLFKVIENLKNPDDSRIEVMKL